MNRRDSNAGNQQAGGYREDGSAWESPRQANQWADEPSRQAGGGWGSGDERSRSGGEAGGGGSRYGEARDEAGYRRGARHGRDPRYRERLSGDDYVDPGYQGSSYERSGYQGTGYQGRGEDRGYRFSGQHQDYPLHDFDASGGNDFSSFTSEDYGGRDFYARGGGYGGGFSPSNSYRPTYDVLGRHQAGTKDYGSWREYGESRGFFQRAGDEIASWFGDEDAARRREEDHRGRGPSDYTRSDERIRDDVNDRLTQDPRIDATHVRVTAKDGELTLDGTVSSRGAKRRAEDLADDVTGVKHVQNNLRVTESASWAGSGLGDTSGTTGRAGSAIGTSTTGSTTTGSTTGSGS